MIFYTRKRIKHPSSFSSSLFSSSPGSVWSTPPGERAILDLGYAHAWLRRGRFRSGKAGGPFFLRASVFSPFTFLSVNGNLREVRARSAQKYRAIFAWKIARYFLELLTRFELVTSSLPKQKNILHLVCLAIIFEFYQNRKILYLVVSCCNI